MTVQTLKLGGKRFVVVPEKAYRDLERRAKSASARRPAKAGASQRAIARDRADVELAEKRLADPREKPIPYQQVRAELGLA
jgi:hypothetical protein